MPSNPAQSIQDVARQLVAAGATLQDCFSRDGFVAVPQALPLPLIEHWRGRALELRQYARSIDRHEDFDLVYRVVTGDVIRAHWPELWIFYHDERVLAWVRDITGETAIYTSEQIASAVNLNIIDGQNSVYRWHFDAVPYTALVYLTDVNSEDGGALELIPGCAPHTAPELSAAHILRIFPKAGTIVLMDGTRCYHRVAPMLKPGFRLSIPLVFPNTRTTQRPAGLDSYLYEPSR